MDGDFDRTVLSRLPLAESVLTLMRWSFDRPLLEASYEEHRGRCHERLLSFSEFVHFLFDCLSLPWKSARAGLLKADDDGRLPVSVRAFYDKLKNTPVDVSLAFFRETARLVRAVMPDCRGEQAGSEGCPACPASLQGMTTLLMDGKVVKHVCRRLKPLRLDRQTACKLLGPRTLVLVDRWTGLLHDLVVDLDGEANEVKHVDSLLQQVPASVSGSWLIVGDRAFGIFEVCRNIVDRGGHFLFRKHGGTRFVADPEQPARHSRDRFGRPVVETWGWIVRGKETKTKAGERLAARQIEVERDASELVLIDSFAGVAHAERPGADDLLDAYLARWDIENAFQHVTEVFHLRTLISSSPRGMLFQLALTFLMHNVVQVVKRIIAHQERLEAQTVSTEMLFRDIQEELVSLKRLATATQAIELIERAAAFPTALAVRERLRQLLKGCWCNRWRKANHRPRDPSKRALAKPPKLRQQKDHDSVQRILERDDP
jgi:hypothetical protein